MPSEAEARGIPIYVLRSNTGAQIEEGLGKVAHSAVPETTDALHAYLRALEADPACVLAEERLLVVAAEALDRGGTRLASFSRSTNHPGCG